MTKKHHNPILHMFKIVWRYAPGNRHNILLYCSMTVIANTIALFSTVILGTIFNSVQSSIADPELLSRVIQLMILYVVLDLAFWIFHGPSRIIEKRNAFLVRHNFRNDLISKTIDLPVEWHKNHHSGNTIDKINRAADDLHGFAEMIFQIIENTVRLFGAAIILIFFDYRASIIALGTTILAIVMMLEFDKKIRELYLERNIFKNKLAAAIQDYIANVYTIITLKLKPRVLREVNERSWNWYGLNDKISRISETKWFLVSMVISFMTVGVVILNATESYNSTGIIALGTLFVLYRYLQGVGDIFYQFAWRYGEILREHASVVSALGLIEAHEKLPLTEKASLSKNWKRLEIKNLKFTYQIEDQGKKILNHIDNVNITINKKSRIALIGESGSGKSTLMSLLRGLYLPDEATLLVDGKKQPKGLIHIYDKITLIPQEPELFNNTVRDNITMDTRINDRELEKAINMAQFRSILKRIPSGLETNVLEKGVSLSGGEKQRLALARGLLAARDSEILLLDEPTSSVDSVNEIKIYENIFSSFRQKTIIATIHRLHLLQFFDYIYMFDRGEIIKEGTLKEMLKYKNFRLAWNRSNQEPTTFE